MQHILEQVQYKEWAKNGLSFSEDLFNTNNEHLVENIESASYHSIVLAISLMWTKHAKESKEFVKYAALYFENKFELTSAFLKNHAARFGIDGLEKSMIGLREFKAETKKITPDFRSCSPSELNLYQTKALNRLENYKKKGFANGVGPWLFLGPFKIILGLEKRMWNDATIDVIVMPSGVEVIKGIEKAIKGGYSAFKDFKSEYLNKEERTLLDGVAVDKIIQTYFSKVADTTKTRAIHINSAFYLYGGNYT
jgi:hypothetical protein